MFAIQCVSPKQLSQFYKTLPARVGKVFAMERVENKVIKILCDILGLDEAQ